MSTFAAHPSVSRIMRKNVLKILCIIVIYSQSCIDFSPYEYFEFYPENNANNYDQDIYEDNQLSIEIRSSLTFNVKINGDKYVTRTFYSWVTTKCNSIDIIKYECNIISKNSNYNFMDVPKYYISYSGPHEKGGESLKSVEIMLPYMIDKDKYDSIRLEKLMKTYKKYINTNDQIIVDIYIKYVHNNSTNSIIKKLKLKCQKRKQQITLI